MGPKYITEERLAYALAELRDSLLDVARPVGPADPDPSPFRSSAAGYQHRIRGNSPLTG